MPGIWLYWLVCLLNRCIFKKAIMFASENQSELFDRHGMLNLSYNMDLTLLIVYYINANISDRYSLGRSFDMFRSVCWGTYSQCHRLDLALDFIFDTRKNVTYEVFVKARPDADWKCKEVWARVKDCSSMIDVIDNIINYIKLMLIILLLCLLGQYCCMVVFVIY